MSSIAARPDTTLNFPDATAVATGLNALGGIYSDFLGKGLLSFSATHLSFRDLEFAYGDLETPKLRSDRFLFRTSLSLTVMVEGTQYRFDFRGAAQDIKALPIPLEVTEDRHLFINGIIGLIVLQMVIKVLVLVFK